MRRHLYRFLLAALLTTAGAAHALTAEEARAMAVGESQERSAAIGRALLTADAQTETFLKALADDAVRYTEQQVFVVRDDKAFDAVTNAPLALPEDAEEVASNNFMRSAIDRAMAALKLASIDVAERAQAIQALLGDPSPELMPMVDKALAAEQVPALRERLARVRAGVQLYSDDPAARLAAAKLLGQSNSPDVKLMLNQRLAEETDAAVKQHIVAAVQAIDASLIWGERLGQAFTGISLGSILLLVALGLAITYGLMGVINMAHGELMMIGAYATYVMQGLFQKHLPGLFDFYLLAALPVAFGASALVGALLERGVIRFLYGRPLETLLATWGISLMLMQAVRSLFGAQNVGVENPSWMSGGLQVMPNLLLPWNRVLILLFAVLVLMGTAYLISRTRLGLFVRGVTQNRPIAACMGVNTARIDTYAFALGSGIAGLAGCALSQIGNVGPDLGQNYIVDAFMVVVVGGVGQLAGTVYAALGLGILNKLLEGWSGAVLAKIAVLVMIIIFIQKRPQGIFAMKGRSAEA